MIIESAAMYTKSDTPPLYDDALKQTSPRDAKVMSSVDEKRVAGSAEKSSSSRCCSSRPAARTPMDPLPPSFSRPAPTRKSLPDFPACVVEGVGKFLEDGFAGGLPAPHMQPHPLTIRDVTDTDWRSFLDEIKVTGSLTRSQKIRSVVFPMMLGASGFFVSRCVRKGMKRKKNAPVAELIDTWNDAFFSPRGLEITLYHGSKRLSGLRGTHLPASQSMQNLDANGRKSMSTPGLRRTRSNASSASSSSSSSSDSSNGGANKLVANLDRKAHREARSERHAVQKQERQERQSEKKEAKRQDKQRFKDGVRYKLIVAPPGANLSNVV